MLFDYPRELRTNQALVVGMHAFFAKLGIASPIFIGASDGGHGGVDLHPEVPERGRRGWYWSPPAAWTQLR